MRPNLPAFLWFHCKQCTVALQASTGTCTETTCLGSHTPAPPSLHSKKQSFPSLSRRRRPRGGEQRKEHGPDPAMWPARETPLRRALLLFSSDARRLRRETQSCARTGRAFSCFWKFLPLNVPSRVGFSFDAGGGGLPFHACASTSLLPVEASSNGESTREGGCPACMFPHPRRFARPSNFRPVSVSAQAMRYRGDSRVLRSFWPWRASVGRR